MSHFIVWLVIIKFCQQHYWRDHLFSPLSLLGLFFKYSLTVHVCVYFCALISVPLVCVYIFMPVPYCFGYDSFAVKFENRNCDASNFVLLSDDSFDYLWAFSSSVQIWGFSFLFLCKMSLEFWQRLHLIFKMVLGSLGILKVPISNHMISFYVFVFCLFSCHFHCKDLLYPLTIYFQVCYFWWYWDHRIFFHLFASCLISCNYQCKDLSHPLKFYFQVFYFVMILYSSLSMV